MTTDASSAGKVRTMSDDDDARVIVPVNNEANKNKNRDDEIKITDHKDNEDAFLMKEQRLQVLDLVEQASSPSSSMHKHIDNSGQVVTKTLLPPVPPLSTTERKKGGKNKDEDGKMKIMDDTNSYQNPNTKLKPRNHDDTEDNQDGYDRKERRLQVLDEVEQAQAGETEENRGPSSQEQAAHQPNGQSTTAAAATIIPGAFRIFPSSHPQEHEPQELMEEEPPSPHPEEPRQTLLTALDAHLVQENDKRSGGEDEEFEKELQRRMLEIQATATRVVPVSSNKKTPQEEEHSRRSSSSKSAAVWCLFVFGLISITVVGIAVVIAPTAHTTEDDVVTPTIDDVVTPTIVPVPPLSDLDIAAQWLTPIVTTNTTLNQDNNTGTINPLLTDITSPQYKALSWLVNDDPSQMLSSSITNHCDSSSNCELPPNSLLERYVVALLYFVMAGDNWFNSYDFLSATPVCEWPPVEEGEDIDLQPGVRCDDKGSVIYLRLDDNNLNGTIPNELSVLSSLQLISMGGDPIGGSIPSSFGSLERLQRLEIPYLELTGTLPESMGNLRKLKTLVAFNNYLTGTIPEGIYQIPSLTKLDLWFNYLTGTIPSNSSPDPILGELWLSGNLLIGTLPDDLYSMVELSILSVLENQLTGSLSTEIGKLKELYILEIDANYLNQALPTELGELLDLTDLFLSYNEFSGTIPSELGRLTRLTDLQLQANYLSGTIPIELINLPAGHTASFGLNNLTGNLTEFCNQKDIFTRIHADCGLTGDGDVHSSQVYCPCCTTCCDSASGNCTTNLEAECALFKAEFELETEGTNCECSSGETGISLSCSDRQCETCNSDGTVCAVSSPFIVNYDEWAEWYNYKVTFQYVVGRNDTVTIEQWIYSDLTDRCEVTLNGEVCNSCSIFECADHFAGYVADCNNVIVDGVAAGKVDFCDDDADDTGPLAVFTLQDPTQVQGCPLMDPY